MKKTLLIRICIAAISLIAAYSIFIQLKPRQESVQVPPKIESATSPMPLAGMQDLKLPQGEIVEIIKVKNWPALQDKISASVQKPTDLENKLSQIIYSLDSKLITENDHEKIAEILCNLISNKNKFQPRTLILISKSFGKLKMSKALKKKIENIYTKNKWIKTQYWLDVSIEWSPLPQTTFQQLNSLLKKNRTDLISDYFYYAHKIQDKKLLKALISKAKNTAKLFSPSAQQQINLKIKNLESQL